MNAANELRVWAKHLAGRSLTVIDRDVPFDSAGRSAVLTLEEFNDLRAIPSFATDGPVPSTRDFLSPAFTVTDWLCCLGLSTVLVESLTAEQRETLALDLRGIGGPFAIGQSAFAEKMGRKIVAAHIERHAPPAEKFDLETFTEEVLDEVTTLSGGSQHPDAAALLGLNEVEGEPTDMLTQFNELTAEARAEFVLDGDLTREQLDALFNVEGQGKKSKKVLSALATALQRLPNRDAYSINDALVKASAQEN